MHVILDCDDVLLSWIDGFRNWLATRGITTETLVPDSWSLTKWIGNGHTDDTASALIDEFNRSHDFGNLVPVDGSVEAVNEMRRQGMTLTVLTSCSDDPQIVWRRQQNLRRHFGDAFERVICLPLGQSKSTWLSVLREGVWIEDNYKNALAGERAGHFTYVLRRAHNRADEPTSHPDISWCDTLSDALSLFN